MLPVSLGGRGSDLHAGTVSFGTTAVLELSAGVHRTRLVPAVNARFISNGIGNGGLLV